MDDSHFIVQMLRCGDCGQPYLWITTEIVDWKGGNDPQYRRVVPVTDAEAETFAREAPELDLEALAELGRGRRYLVSDWPSEQSEPRLSWAEGRISFT